LADVGAARPAKAHAGLGHLAALLADLLALVVREAGEEGVEVGIAGVGPVELHGVAQHQPGLGAGGTSASAAEQQVQRRELLFCLHSATRPCTSSVRLAASRASSRVPGTGVNGTATTALG
jgi:hypothetical protein